MKNILAVVLIGFVIWLVMSSKDSPTSSDDAEVSISIIQTHAERFVKEHLKTPSTADFGGFFEVPEIRQHKDDPSIFWIFGKVTAQNSFGAKLTKEYAVEMQQICSEDYKGKCWKALNG